jgi:hypothetical protein
MKARYTISKQKFIAKNLLGYILFSARPYGAVPIATVTTTIVRVYLFAWIYCYVQQTGGLTAVNGATSKYLIVRSTALYTSTSYIHLDSF